MPAQVDFILLFISVRSSLYDHAPLQVHNLAMCHMSHLKSLIQHQIVKIIFQNNGVAVEEVISAGEGLTFQVCA